MCALLMLVADTDLGGMPPVPCLQRRGPSVRWRPAHQRYKPTRCVRTWSHPRPPARGRTAVWLFRQPLHARCGPPVRWRAANLGGVQRGHQLRHPHRRCCAFAPQAVVSSGAHLAVQLVAGQPAEYGLPNPALKRKANGGQQLRASLSAVRAVGFRLALRWA